jgi:hypothetical protein
MGAIGGILRATSGPPSVSTVSSVKNKALGANIDNAIAGYGQVASQGDQALSDYISKYMAGEGAAQNRTNQEIGGIDQFYNGAMANQLAQLRAERASAMTNAADVATKQALRAQSNSRLTGSGGLGSYNSRQTIAALQPIRVQAALDNANQARTDLGYITQNQLGLTGQRNALAANQAAYGLVPQQQRLAMLQQRAGYLGNLGNLDQQNTFYGLQQKPNMWADVADSLDQGILNAAAIYGSVGSPGMGGAGKKKGGLIKGPGTETSDSIPIRVSKGEYVLPAEVTHMTGVLPLLERIRKIALKHREERLKFGHHVDGSEPIDVDSEVTQMASGGMVPAGLTAYRRGFAQKRDNPDLETVPTSIPAPHAQRMVTPPVGRRRGLTPMGYADGGLAGSAQQLGARAMADLTPEWGGAVILPTTGGTTGTSVGDAGGVPRRGLAPMPTSTGTRGLAPGQSPFFTPSNYNDLTPEWKAYGDYWSNYYNNPKSPGYVKPGTYE